MSFHVENPTQYNMANRTSCLPTMCASMVLQRIRVKEFFPTHAACISWCSASTAVCIRPFSGWRGKNSVTHISLKIATTLVHTA